MNTIYYNNSQLKNDTYTGYFYSYKNKVLHKYTSGHELMRNRDRCDEKNLIPIDKDFIFKYINTEVNNVSYYKSIYPLLIQYLLWKDIDV